MTSAERSEFFWNAPFALESERAADPLGFDALREAMSNVLVPFLTGATTHAEHYIAVLVGLRWATASSTNPVDRQIWSHFEKFERGLKQYWYRHPAGRPARNRYLGKRRIAEICKGPGPNVEAPILQDQRGIGILANYIESLRAIGLVKPGTLRLNVTAVTEMLGEPRFEWKGTSPRRWSELDSAFECVDQRSAWRPLGQRLFGGSGGALGEGQMYRAACAVLTQSNATGWGHVARSLSLSVEQRVIAGVASATAELEARLRKEFGELLDGRMPKDKALAAPRVQRLARALVRTGAVERAWPDDPPLAGLLRRQFEMLAAGQGSLAGLVEWHVELARVRGTEPWIAEVGEHSRFELPAQRGASDFRFGNLKNLLGETKWRPARS